MTDRPSIVFVKWRDATSFDHLHPNDIEGLEGVMIKRENVGFLLKKTKDFILIASGVTRSLPVLDHTEDIRDFDKIIAIPTSQIDEIEESIVDEETT